MGKKVKDHLFGAGITLLVGAVAYYVALPALNIHSAGLIGFILFLLAVYAAALGVFQLRGGVVPVKGTQGIGKTYRVLLLFAGALVVAALLGNLIGAKFFNAGRYQKLLSVEEGNFTTDVSRITYDQIPTLDRDSARMLGDRKMGELSDMVSQFSVMDNYTQINYQGRPVRVTPLAYADLFKWMSNMKEGVPGYLLIDMVTQEAELKRLPEGMKYSTAEHFNRNLTRHLRFQFPTKIFESETFEIDESGMPYWVCPTYRYTIGLYGGQDIDGAVLVNAVTGECHYYPVTEIPTWVDRVFGAELIISQYNYYGTYVHGFWNSVFAQKDCRVTTEGYNYLAMGDDVYLYTGVTSVAADESNVGFILSNQRTKETRFYSIPGAEEYSAMTSAEGQVQEMRYTATFPLLLNIDNEPTYFIALKDAGNLVKQYAMVNVRQYQIVVVGTTLKECEANYVKRLQEEGITKEAPQEIAETRAVTGVITGIRSAVVGGNTCYYYQLDGQTGTFALSVATDERAVILNVGDTVTFTVSVEETGAIIPVQKLNS